MAQKERNLAETISWSTLWLLAIGLRVTFAWVNRESNDNHFQEVIVPLLNNEIGESTLWNFHPKIYHQTVAAFIRWFHLGSTESEIICAQMVNAVAGIVTLYLIFWFLKNLPLPWPIRAMVFGFIALNPGLVSIGAQATNDQFVILFVVAGTLAALAYFKDKKNLTRPRQIGPPVPFQNITFGFFYYCLMLFFIGLAIGTKGNGIGLAVAIGIVMLVHLMIDVFRFRLDQARYVFDFSTLILFCSCAIVYFEVYTSHLAYNRFVNSDRMVIGRFWGIPAGIPQFSKRGIEILKDSLLSLPIGDLFRNPLNSTPGSHGEPLTALYRFTHMRNYWSQIFGNFAIARFHDWPPSWRNPNPDIAWLARGLLFLNLVPVLLLIVGLTLVAKTVLYERNCFATLSKSVLVDSLLLAVFCVVLALGIRYFMIFPGYQFAKFIYIAPCLVPLAYGLACGINLVWTHQVGRGVLICFWGLLFLADVTDLIWLIFDLASKVA